MEGFLERKEEKRRTGDRDGEGEEGDIADLATTAAAGADHHIGEKALDRDGNWGVRGRFRGERRESVDRVFQGPLLLHRLV